VSWKTLRSSLPAKLFTDARAFRIASKFWWTDRLHADECLCEECAGTTLGVWVQHRRDAERKRGQQLELPL